jgi:hypothetical protein
MNYENNEKHNCGLNRRFESEEIVMKNKSGDHHLSYFVNFNYQDKLIMAINGAELVIVKDSVFTTLFINGKNYSVVHLSACDTNNSYQDKIIKAYYNRPYGLLRYEYKSGLVWEIE